MALPRRPVQGATSLPSISVGHIARFLKVPPTSVPLFISPSSMNISPLRWPWHLLHVLDMNPYLRELHSDIGSYRNNEDLSWRFLDSYESNKLCFGGALMSMVEKLL
ncbi:hypothetical protein QL285_003030 [Trifolium repens]|nr:hypothetical protein QL285_003030 [Trifolium repens]